MTIYIIFGIRIFPICFRVISDDMYELLKRMKDIFVKGSSCYIVVANLGIKGILVLTDLLIADIANKSWL